MQRPMRHPTRLAVLAAAAAISACGGGGDDAPVTPPVVTPPVVTPPAPTTTPVAITVMDGLLQNALVCLDANKNGACDAGETQARTGANGQATLEVPNADVGKYPVVAVVGTDAIDADSGAVATAYLLKAPADRPAVVSPWSTLVQEQIATLGFSTAEAEKLVKSQAGLQVSPLSDYAAQRATDAGAATASRAARALVAAMQQQLQALLPLAGQPDAGGVVMAAADIQATVLDKLSFMAVSAVSRASRSALAQPCADPASAACNQAITAAGTALADEVLLKPASLPQFAEVRRLFAAAAATTGPTRPQVAGYLLDSVNAGDANNWFYRALITSAAGATPDANGLYSNVDQRRRNTNGTIADYSLVSSPADQSRLHWNGSSWQACVVGSGSKLTPLDAGGLSRADNCDRLSFSVIRRVDVDISGQPMAAVVARIRATRVGAAGFGGPPAGYTGTPPALGNAVFPAGSMLVHRAATDVDHAFLYNPVDANSLVRVYSAEVAAGGDARNGGTPACAVVANQTSAEADSLETMIARNRGTPCVFGQSATAVDGNQITSPDPNEWSGQSTLAIATLGSAALNVTPHTAFATSNTLIRLAFTGAGQVRYYGCLQRWDGSPRNCTAIGTGTYTITTLGDARVLTLGNAPGQTAPLDYERVFVERAGKVYVGQRNKEGFFYQPRLNGTAGNALLTQLGVPQVSVP